MRVVVLASLVVWLPACSSSHVVVGGHDAGLHDAGHDPGPDAGHDDGGAPRTCGGFVGLPCEADEFCDFPDWAMCGAGDALGICRPLPRACDLSVDPHCGCDGVTYSNACAAHAAGVDTLRPGACEEPCQPDDAQGEGLCDAIVGIAWDGRDCVHLSGCSCVGSDCGRWSSVEECLAAHAMCPVPL